ncbi:MAG: zinc finger domain-containing protein [archaeon]|nr:zinc finger domain-containing protein [archaeon]
MDEMYCSGCGASIAAGERSVKFKCPGCGAEIIRCSKCKITSNKYACSKCGFAGP